MAEVVRVVGAAVLRDGRCLAAQRSETMAEPGRWELPGGKVEPGEDPRQALRRELREELGVEVEVGAAVGRGEAWRDGRRIQLDVYVAELRRGMIRRREHRAHGWFTADELGRLEWAEADVPVVAAVRQRMRGGIAPIDQEETR